MIAWPTFQGASFVQLKTYVMNAMMVFMSKNLQILQLDKLRRQAA
jgi:hypothetical protein